MASVDDLCKKYGYKGPKTKEEKEQIIRDAAYGNLLYEKPWLTREEFDKATESECFKSLEPRCGR